MSIFRILGIGALVLFAGIVGLVVFLMVIFGHNGKQINSRKLVKSQDFLEFHELVLNLEGVRNIAVLPEENYIVVDGTVINVLKRTFGSEPSLGFYHSYYFEGDKTPFNSIDSLFTSKGIQIDSSRAIQIVDKMKGTNISDVFIDIEGICYRWDVSAMYGEEGIIYSKNFSKDSSKYDFIEPIDTDFYHFAVYK